MRLIIALVGFASVIIFPAWVPVVCIIMLSMRYRAWEAIGIGALIDLTWLPGSASFHLVPFYTMLAILVVWGFEPLRARFLVTG